MGDTKFDELITDLVKVSSFVYGFRDLRAVVKKNKQGTIKKRSTGWFSSEEYKVEYVTPAHIITQKGAQEDNKNQHLKYDITLAAIKQFLEENRKWFLQDGNKWTFDESRTEKKHPFPLENELDVLMEDNLRMIDYVSMSSICCYITGSFKQIRMSQHTRCSSLLLLLTFNIG